LAKPRILLKWRRVARREMSSEVGGGRTWERGLTANSGTDMNSSAETKPPPLRSSWQKRWYRDTISCCETSDRRREASDQIRSDQTQIGEGDQAPELADSQAWSQWSWTSSMSYWVSMEEVLPISGGPTGGGGGGGAGAGGRRSRMGRR